MITSYFLQCRGISVGIVVSDGMDDRGSIPGRGKIFFSIPEFSDRLWGPPSLLSIGNRELFLRG
jgi:hypothetical protein